MKCRWATIISIEPPTTLTFATTATRGPNMVVHEGTDFQTRSIAWLPPLFFCSDENTFKSHRPHYQQQQRRWASPRHYTVDPMLLPSGNPFKCHEEVLYFQLLIPHLNVLTFFPPDWGMLRRSRCIQIFL